tara:strand:+ start:702 stop:1160 length:459 start_codon:yes stop_codon:yes gene_type:complete
MNVADLINEGSILINIESKSKKNILETISKNLANGDANQKDTIFDKLYEREKLGTTAFGNGIAIPHARIPNMKSPKILFMKLSEGIDFDALDKKKVDLIFSLVVPDTREDSHIEILSKVASLADSEIFAQKIRGLSDEKDILDLIKNNLQSC